MWLQKRSPCHLSEESCHGPFASTLMPFCAFENPQFKWAPQTCERPKSQEADVGSLRVKCWFAKRTAPCRTWQRLDRPKPNSLHRSLLSEFWQGLDREKGD